MKISIAKKIDALFSGYDGRDVPGFAVAVVEHGKVTHSRGYGMASLEHGVPIGRDTVFDIGSTTKQFVAFCTALLELRGKISLEDDIRKFFPEMPRYEAPVRIKHLIFHTSGIRDYLSLMRLAGMRYENEYADQEIMGLVCRQKRLNFRPGSEFLYSNSGYLLLAEIVKKVSGQTLAAFADKNIFRPLGMRRTHFHDDFRMIVRNKASGYSMLDTGIKTDMSLFDAVGDGGVNTTAEDLAKWDRNFYRNSLGGGQALIARITEPGKLDDGRGLEYAWGLFVTEYRGVKMISHGGAWMGYRAEILRFPEKDISVICLANFSQAKATYMAKQVADICLNGQLSGAPVSSVQPQADLSRQGGGRRGIPAGFYKAAAGGEYVEISREDGKLFFRDGESRCELSCSGKRRWAAVSAARPIDVELLSSRTPEIAVKKLGAASMMYSKIQTRPMPRRELKRLEGTYRSDELGADYRVLSSPAGLLLSTPSGEKIELRRVDNGLFSGNNFTVDFEMPPAPRKKFLLGSGRVKGLSFVEVL